MSLAQDVRLAFEQLAAEKSAVTVSAVGSRVNSWSSPVVIGSRTCYPTTSSSTDSAQVERAGRTVINWDRPAGWRRVWVSNYGAAGSNAGIPDAVVMGPGGPTPASQTPPAPPP